MLCYPMGREYVLIHRTYLQLTTRLAKSGFYVLRFDYHGCGDSAGDEADVAISECLNNIAIAIDELKKRSGWNKVCLVGQAVGATLATLAASERNDVDSLVLWDIVINGRDYVKERLDLHKAWLDVNLFRPKQKELEPNEGEVLGFLLPPALRGELEDIDLLALPQLLVEKVFFVLSREDTSITEFHQHLLMLHRICDMKNIPWPAWIQSGEVFEVLAPPVKILQPIIEWIGKEHP